MKFSKIKRECILIIRVQVVVQDEGRDEQHGNLNSFILPAKLFDRLCMYS